MMALTSILSMLDKNMLDLIKKLDKMEDPEIKVVSVKNYMYKGKKWNTLILIRDASHDKDKNG